MQTWSTLSGGEAQRIALAIAVGIGGAEVVLLDGRFIERYSALRAEPTSALDEVTMQKVEKSLLSLLGSGPKAYIWITHEEAQADRVGTRTFIVGE